MNFTFRYLLNSLSGWNLTRYAPNFDIRFTEAMSGVISLFPLSFSGVCFLAFLGGRRHGLMLIHENDRLSIKHSLAGGLHVRQNRMLLPANSTPVYYSTRPTQWVIPENIRTLPRVASWNSEGMGGGFMRLEFRRHGGVLETGIPSAWGVFRS